MQYGRDHQEREQKVRIHRASQPRDDDSFEGAWLGAGRQRGTPRQRVFGANQGRFAPGEEPLDEREPVADGAEVGPTARAEARERERHRQERQLGRMAAGIGENLRDRREPAVTRGDLDRAARSADRKVTRSE
jgi:hypothetical protein